MIRTAQWGMFATVLILVQFMLLVGRSLVYGTVLAPLWIGIVVELAFHGSTRLDSVMRHLAANPW